MYFETIAQIGRSFQAMEGWLDKAERHAAAANLDIATLLNGRLAPDMGAFIYQVQSASDYLKAGAAWLSGQRPPAYADDEVTIEDVRARIRKTVAFVESVLPAEYAQAGARRVGVSWSPRDKVVAGEDYLLQVVLPNAYFHIAMGYAILRHRGVDVGKMDFLSPINWVDA